jgi:hypothetical protein
MKYSFRALGRGQVVVVVDWDFPERIYQPWVHPDAVVRVELPQRSIERSFRHATAATKPKFAIPSSLLPPEGSVRAPALGKGTPARGGKNFAVFIRILSDGGLIAFEPSAIVHHMHRETKGELRRQSSATASACPDVFGVDGAGSTVSTRDRAIAQRSPNALRLYLGSGNGTVRKNSGDTRYRLSCGFAMQPEWRWVRPFTSRVVRSIRVAGPVPRTPRYVGTPAGLRPTGHRPREPFADMVSSRPTGRQVSPGALQRSNNQKR